MNAITQLEEQLKTESGRIAGRVSEIQQVNAKDQEILASHAERFAEAVQDEASEEELAALEAQRIDAYNRVRQNQEIIRILTTNEGSKVQRLRADLVGEHLDAISVIEKEAKVLHQKLSTIREQLKAGAKELKALSDRQIEHMRKIDRLPLDRAAQLQYGLAEDREMDGQRMIADNLDYRTVAAMLHSLLFRPFVDIENGEGV